MFIKIWCNIRMNETFLRAEVYLHFIHLDINSLLSKCDKLCFIAKYINAAVIGIWESKLDSSVLEQKVSIDNYKILFWLEQTWRRCSLLRNKRLKLNILSVFSRETENIFFEGLPNSKPITAGKIHRPQNKTNFLEVLSKKMNKINPVDNEIYIFGHFNIYLFLNDSYILEKKNILISKSIPSDAKSYHELYFRKKRIFWLASQFQVMLKATMNFAHFLD